VIIEMPAAIPDIHAVKTLNGRYSISCWYCFTGVTVYSYWWNHSSC